MAIQQSDAGLRQCGSSEWCWKFRTLKAESLLALGEYAAALRLLKEADAPLSDQLQARRLMDQGRAMYRLSDLQRADGLLSAAHQRAVSGGSQLLVAQVDSLQSLVWSQMGKFDEAEVTLRRALNLASPSGDRYVEANIMGNLGYLFQTRSRYDEGIYWFQQSFRLSESIGAQTLSDATVGNLGTCFYELGDLENALANFEAAEARSARAGNKGLQQLWLGNSGLVAMDQGDISSAVDRFTRALAIARQLSDPSSIAISMVNLAEANILIGKVDEAERYNNEAIAIQLKLGDKRNALYDQLNAANIAAARKQASKAEETYASIISAASEDPTPALQAQEGLAKLYIETGQPQKAEIQFQSAIAAIEQRQAGLTKEDYKLSYLSSLVRFYRSYVDFLVARNDIGKALGVVESSRARILTERTDGAGSRRTGFSAPAIQALARSSGRVFLSYWLAPKKSYLFAVTPSKVQLLTLPPEKEIRTLVESYRTIIEDLRDPLQSGNRAGARLSEVLLGPVRTLAPPGSHVVVVPDGALHSLNFATLPAPDDPAKYWIEDVTLSVTPSLGLVLNSHADKKTAMPRLLAIGDPESPGQEFPRLPNARKEVDTIAALFSDPNKSVYEGAQSQPSVYRRAEPERFSFIHFAAHATANRASPLDSALILSPEGNTYSLTARDIMKIPLDADVVTLSSCRSAGARAYSGEGLVGLTWAFLQAGARNVVAGLWDVDDESTSRLMSRLYAGLTHGVPPDDALRTAQLSLLHGGYPYTKPYYWGPFQLYSRSQKPYGAFQSARN